MKYAQMLLQEESLFYSDIMLEAVKYSYVPKLNELIWNLLHRLIRYWADSAEVQNEIKYAEQAIAQLKKLEKKASGKDKERFRKEIAKIEKTLKEVKM